MEYGSETVEIKDEIVKIIDEFILNLMSEDDFELEMKEIIRRVCSIKDNLR